MLQPAKTDNVNYAQMLRELADRIESAQDQVTGLYLSIFWRQNNITEHTRHTQGFRPLEAAGFLLKAAAVYSTATDTVPMNLEPPNGK